MSYCWGDLPDTEEAPREDNQTQDMIDYIHGTSIPGKLLGA